MLDWCTVYSAHIADGDDDAKLRSHVLGTQILGTYRIILSCRDLQWFRIALVTMWFCICWSKSDKVGARRPVEAHQWWLIKSNDGLSNHSEKSFSQGSQLFVNGDSGGPGTLKSKIQMPLSRARLVGRVKIQLNAVGFELNCIPTIICKRSLPQIFNLCSIQTTEIELIVYVTDFYTKACPSRRCAIKGKSSIGRNPGRA